MTARVLEVSINGQAVGQLTENDTLWQFEYTPGWAASAHGFDLSPALARRAGVLRDGASMRPVQWYFDNLLPEEALRTLLAKEAGIDADDAFSLLARFGAESAGALELRLPGDAAPRPQGLRPLPLAALNQRILDLPHVSLTHDAPKKMSLAGAQHKLLAVWQNGTLFEPLAATPSTHILKPEHRAAGYPASVMNEYFTMRLAAAVGLNVPAVQRLYAPAPVYLVERFDRMVTSGAQPQRRHIIDTCQLLNKARSFKYTAARLQTLAQGVAQCRSRAAARLRLYQWVVFNLLVGNGDNHLKNISFTVDAQGVNLAPFYDLLCTAVYETPAMADHRATWPATPLAMGLDGADTFAQVTREHVLAAGHALGLADATTRRELDRLRHSLPGEAARLAAQLEAGMPQALAASPDPAAAQAHAAGELRLLRAIRHVVIEPMCARLAERTTG